MTEAEWLVCEEPRVMLTSLREKVSERKLRLFACSCCHMVRHLIVDDRSWHAVVIAERYADGLATVGELDTAAETANGIWLDLEDPVRRRAGEAAFKSAVVLPEELWQLKSTWAEAALAIEGNAIATTWATTPEEAQQMLEAWQEAWGGSCEPMDWTDANPKRDIAARLRDIFGNPFRPVAFNPAWLTSTVLALARGIYDERAFDRMPILADALQDAGCDNDDILTHCRGPGPHVRGCWVVDLVLGKTS
jgi:hypothetical protein